MQVHLLKLAEDILGPRDTSKTICQPTFTDHGPNIRNTPNLDGAFAELSRNAEGYWPTVVNELAHETVHLLNPRPGIGNWLSEGMAVAFSNFAQRRYGMEHQSINMESYRRSLKSRIRATSSPSGSRPTHPEILAGASTLQTRGILETLYPTVDPKTLAELCSPFDRDWPGSEI